MLTNESRAKNSAAVSGFQFQPPDGASTCAAYIAANRSQTRKRMDTLLPEQLQELGGCQQSCVVWRENQVLQTRSHARSGSSAGNVLSNLFVQTVKEVVYKN